MLELCSWGLDCLCFCLHVSRIVLAFWREKAHGMPFGAVEKVPLCGNLVKKEVMWQIFSEKGMCVARPPCHFPQLSEKGRWVAQPQQGKVSTRRFLAKKETVWCDLKICQIFFISLCTSTD